MLMRRTLSKSFLWEQSAVWQEGWQMLSTFGFLRMFGKLIETRGPGQTNFNVDYNDDDDDHDSRDDDDHAASMRVAALATVRKQVSPLFLT